MHTDVQSSAATKARRTLRIVRCARLESCRAGWRLPIRCGRTVDSRQDGYDADGETNAARQTDPKLVRCHPTMQPAQKIFLNMSELVSKVAVMWPNWGFQCYNGMKCTSRNYTIPRVHDARTRLPPCCQAYSIMLQIKISNELLFSWAGVERASIVHNINHGYLSPAETCHLVSVYRPCQNTKLLSIVESIYSNNSPWSHEFHEILCRRLSWPEVHWVHVKEDLWDNIWAQQKLNQCAIIRIHWPGLDPSNLRFAVHSDIWRKDWPGGGSGGS